MMSEGGSISDEISDTASIVVDYDAMARNMDIKLDSQPKKHATSKLTVSSTNAIYELLKCPSCSRSMYPPIIQCPNGHTLCSKCKNKVNNRCPSCRREMGNIRCLALERVAELLEFSCRYSFSGCQHVLPYCEKINHEQDCKFRPYNCPYAGPECSVTGDIATLIAHLTNDHKVDMHLGSTFNHRYVKSNALEVETATWMLTVRCFTALASISVFTLRRSCWGTPQYSWPSFYLWGKKMRPMTSGTAWRLEEVRGSWHGRVCQRASVTTTEKYVIAQMACLYPEISHCSSLVVIIGS